MFCQRHVVPEAEQVQIDETSCQLRSPMQDHEKYNHSKDEWWWVRTIERTGTATAQDEMQVAGREKTRTWIPNTLELIAAPPASMPFAQPRLRHFTAPKSRESIGGFIQVPVCFTFNRCPPRLQPTEYREPQASSASYRAVAFDSSSRSAPVVLH